MKERLLKEQYADICYQYLQAFNAKHELEMNDYDLKTCWIGGEVGGIADINDMYINFDDIRYDIDNKISVGKIFEWYWNSVERAELKVKYMNYPSYCKGAPDPITPEDLEDIKKCRERLEEARRAFYESIKDYEDKEMPEPF